MSPDQCQNTPLGCYLQTGALDASKQAQEMQKSREPAQEGTGFEKPNGGPATTFQPTPETRETPGDGRALHTVLFESEDQMLAWCVLKPWHLQGQNQTQRKSRGKKNKEWQ